MNSVDGEGEAMTPEAQPRVERVAPLSSEQHQHWVLQQLMEQPAAGTARTAVRMHGPLDIVALRESLTAFIRRHEIWRTVFPNPDGTPEQVVLAHGDLAWSTADLAELEEADLERALLRLGDEQSRQPFDLARGPLVRTLLVRVSHEDHRLLLTLHRMIFDRTSLTQVFLPELWRLYTATMEGRPAELDEVQVQYAEFATLQEARRHETTDTPDLTFWRQYLAGAPTVLALPHDHRRPERRSYQGGAQSFALSPELTSGLRELSQQAHVTIRTTLTAAFAALLSRYTGEEDLLIGLTASRSEETQLQRAVGCYSDTVVLRADLAGQPNVLELLKRTQAAGDAMQSHEDTPFDAVVHESQPEFSRSFHPLVQVRLRFEPAAPPLPVEWELAPLEFPLVTTPFDLSLELDEQPSGMTGQLVYDSDLFEPGTIRRMIGHWSMILEEMVAVPWSPIGELPLIGPEERQQLLCDWSLGREPDAGPDIIDLIAEQAKSRPDAVAVSCEGEQLTYRQMNGRANRLAHHLRQLGVKAEVTVGVCLDRSPNHVIALLGILKAGGAYIPLDPEAPTERIQYVLEDSQTPLVLAGPGLEGKVSGTGASVFVVDRAWEAIGQHSEEEPDRWLTDNQLGYVIYTSGSTGKPKGVMVERGALSAHSRSMIAEYGLGIQDRVLQFTQYSADTSLEQILPILATGGRLVMRGNELWTPWQLLEELTRDRVTVVNLSPAHWHQVVQQWARTDQDVKGLTLRLVILGGDRLRAESVEQWRSLGLTGVRLLNAYGPTEATITATLGEAGAEQGLITIGRPLAGRRVYILDGRGQPVPVGVAGELHIGGALLARGYLNRPELTEERFVPDPFGPQPGGRLYRTGDLVRYLEDGRIEYIGRQDDQVQVRGYRVELGEVEAALGQHPAVDEAVVVARGDAGDVHLAAYVVSQESQPLDEAELFRYLTRNLPRHMQPTTISLLEAIPRLPSGKPDRRKLPESEEEWRCGEVPYLAPRLLAEEQLVRIWEELLEPRPIGIRDNFFHLGGHSLLAAQLVYRIEQTLGTKVALSTLFANPTIEQLTEALRGNSGVEGDGKVLPVQVDGTRRPFFFLHGDWTGGAFYCFTLARACGMDQPFYVLEPCTFSSDRGIPTLEAIVRAHVESLREVQPVGPYRLGGFCNGGLLAYEMARQLEAQGEEVEFLVLVNPSRPNQTSLLWAACNGVGTIGRAGKDRSADLYLRTRHALRHIYRHLRPNGSRVEDFEKLLAIEPQLAAMLPAWDALYQDYVGVFDLVAAAYRTGVYRGKITFLWAREESKLPQTWQPVVKQKLPLDIEELSVDGTHMSCITDGIDVLAEILSGCLSRLEEESRVGEHVDLRAPGAATAAHLRDGRPSTGPWTNRSDNSGELTPARSDPARRGDASPNFRIRRLRLRDLLAVVRIERRAFPKDPWTTSTARGWLARSPIGSHRRPANWLARFMRLIRLNQAISLIRLLRVIALKRPVGSSAVVVETDATIVGYAHLHAVPGGLADVHIIAVEPDHQGQGIGGDLLLDLMTAAADCGCGGASLYVRADNPRARQFYRRIGFTDVGSVPGYYQPSGTDALVMQIDFDDSVRPGARAAEPT